MHWGCSWCNRVNAVLRMKGLEDVIEVTPAKPRMGQSGGWEFLRAGEAAEDEPDVEPNMVDPHEGAATVRQLYEISEAPPEGRPSVPVLWDIQKRKIVNNESSDIIRLLNSEFNTLAKNPELDLYPEELRETIDEINEWVYETINNGVYRVGFASTQAAYDEAMDVLFAGLDRAEALLSRQRYLAGDRLTEADIRLFTTLVRFDEVYALYFKANRKLLREYHNLFAFTRDIFQEPGVAETVRFDQMKIHPRSSPSAIVPGGPQVDFSAPHGRAERFKRRTD